MLFKFFVFSSFEYQFKDLKSNVSFQRRGYRSRRRMYLAIIDSARLVHSRRNANITIRVSSIQLLENCSAHFLGLSASMLRACRLVIASQSAHNTRCLQRSSGTQSGIERAASCCSSRCRTKQCARSRLADMCCSLILTSPFPTPLSTCSGCPSASCFSSSFAMPTSKLDRSIYCVSRRVRTGCNMLGALWISMRHSKCCLGCRRPRMRCSYSTASNATSFDFP